MLGRKRRPKNPLPTQPAAHPDKPLLASNLDEQAKAGSSSSREKQLAGSDHTVCSKTRLHRGRAKEGAATKDMRFSAQLWASIVNDPTLFADTGAILVAGTQRT